jgi:ech hydrogenase subunit F
MPTILKAFCNLFKCPATVKYPFVQTYKPDTLRGLIEHTPETCIFCRKCETVCPPGAIVFSQELDGKQEFHYNSHVCIYCGECVRSCPKADVGALVQTNELAPPKTKEDNPNNGWTEQVKVALESRAAYMAEKKKKKAQEKPTEKTEEPAKVSS